MPPADRPSTLDFQVLFDASPNAYVLLDTDFTIVEANDTYLEVTGRKRETLLGQNMFDAFPGDPESSNARRLRASFERVLSTGERDSLALIAYSIPTETEDGLVQEERYWSATHTPIFDEDGEVEYILQHTTDVTELYEKGFYDRGGSGNGRSAEAESEGDEREELAAGADPGAREEEAAGRATPQQIEDGVFSRAEAVQKAYWRSEDEREHLRRLFEQAPGFMVFMRGPDHVFELANEAYYKLIGRRDIIGKPVREALPELEGQGFFELLDRVYQTGESFVGREVEVRLQREGSKEVEPVYVDFLYQPILDPDGSVSGIFTQGHDVTEQKKVKDRLEKRARAVRREKERLRSLLDSIPDEVWFCNPDGEISLVNEAVAENFGFEKGEIAGLFLEELLQETALYDLDGTPRPVKETPLFRALQGEVVEGEEELLHRSENDERQFRQVNAAPISGPSGERAGAVAVARDVTELKRTEKKLRQRERDFTTLANNIPQLAWMANPDGYIFWYNERWYEYTGTTFEEMEGWGWKKVHHPEYRDRVVRRYKEAVDTETPFEETFPLQGRDGEYRWFLTRAMPVRDEEGEVIRWFGTNTDITQRLQLEDQLKSLNETLEERVEHRTRQVRKLTSQVIRAEQRERKRFGHLLHDDLQQRLYGSTLQLSSLRASLQAGGQDELAVEAERVEKQVEEVIQSLRRLSVGMSPPVLESEGLTASLEWLRSHLEEAYELTAHLEAEREFEIADEMQVLLFHTARELLLELARREGMGEAFVTLFEEDGALVLKVWGKGGELGPEQRARLEKNAHSDGEGRMRLSTVRERLRLFGGELTGFSDSGDDRTEVVVRLPLAEDLEAVPIPESTSLDGTGTP